MHITLSVTFGPFGLSLVAKQTSANNNTAKASVAAAIILKRVVLPAKGRRNHRFSLPVDCQQIKRKYCWLAAIG